MFTAHIRETDNACQTVGQHSRNVSALAEGYLRPVSLSQVGRLAGLLHDAGKLRQLFDDYIHKRNSLTRGSIDHSYAGARILRELAKNGDKQLQTAAEAVGHTILSHHGLNDWLDPDGESVFRRRTDKDEGFGEIMGNLSEVCTMAEAEELLAAAKAEWFQAAKKLMCQNKEEFTFYMGMLERLIQSALIDADRTDTADFMSAGETPPEPDNSALWQTMDQRMEEKLRGFSHLTDKISIQRRSISDRCAKFAQHPVGACRLIVPTGGGKTLSSLRFAVKQCRNFGLKRIVYVAPFMSILEQNSDVIRELAGQENFLEHHSNMIPEIDDPSALKQYLLYAERWDRPVIATTMVQFLNTLFSAKTSSVRRMHRLCDSVIIIDEVQSVPIKCTDLFSLAVNFLVKQCGAAVVLCSATQPPFDQKGKFRLILDEEKDMAGDCTKDFQVFRRTEITPLLKKYGYEMEEAAELCCEKFRENGDLLLIVNTKAQAREMYRRLKESLEGEAYLIHLSTNMCPAHRKKRIGTLRRFLKRNKPVICVTTQLIEAGVDISFRCVIRAIAGLDNAAQAAGRCNRSGEYNRICPVYMINFKAENLRGLEEIKTAQRVSRQIIDNCDHDLLSVDIQTSYFTELFRQYSDKLSYNVSDGSSQTNLVELLSTDEKRFILRKETEPVLSQAFKTAGELFSVIDSNTKDIIVPYNKQAEWLISRLESQISPIEARELLRKAQKYTVSIYAGTEKALSEKGALHLNTLDKRFYNNEFGVDLEGAEQEVLLY